jgi:tryptophan synthase alpha chain
MSEAALPAPPPAARSSGRIASRFRELSDAGELGLIIYVTAGDPTLDVTERIVLATAEAGADIVELGVPFSDPVADGPTIQRASERALRNGVTLSAVLDLVARLRTRTKIPLVLFSYFNPILQMGIDKFSEAAASAGVDGALATDLTPEESSDYRSGLRARGLDTIFLAAPTSTNGRLAKIASVSSGFLYLISRTGVTGARESLPEELPPLVRRVRKFTSLPIAVGFGISLPTHVTVLGGIADAAVVGSALMAAIEKAPDADAAVSSAADLVRTLKSAARKGVSRRSSALPQP